MMILLLSGKNNFFNFFYFEFLRCKNHDGDDQYLSPCLTQSKIGAVLHLGFLLSDGSVHYVDMDLTCPMFATSDVDSYDGHTDDYRKYLLSSKLLMWLDENYKLESMTSASGGRDAVRSVRVKKVNRRIVVPNKVIISIFNILYNLYFSVSCS